MLTTATSPKNKKLKLDPSIPELPDDIIFQEILPKLPAKSLVRFQKVAPHWKAYISSVEFAETILSLSSRCVLTLDDDLSSFVALDYNDEKNLVTKEFGKHNRRYHNLCSTCNGLAFLVSFGESNNNGSQLPNELHHFVFNFVVYNPVLGVDHFVEIPLLDGHPLSVEHLTDSPNYNFGFGYVSSLDDFFIVAIDFPLDFEMVVCVYSLRNREWTISPGTIDVEEQTLPLRFQDPWYSHAGTLVKETLYWGIAQGNDIQFIFAFDLEIQNYYELIDLPYVDFGESRTFRDNSAFSLCCLDNSLCAWACDHSNICEMWMFEEDEESDSGYSWVCLFSFKPDYLVRNFFGCNKSGLILVSKDNGELILADFISHPPEFSGVVLDDKWDTVDYVPSLVSVPNMGIVPKKRWLC